MGRVNRKELFKRIVSSLFLLVMLSFLAGKAIHVYSHHAHLEHHSKCISHDSTGDSNHNHNHDNKCKICEFVLSPFIAFESSPFNFLAAFLSVALSLYICRETQFEIGGQNSRAPPYLILN